MKQKLVLFTAIAAGVLAAVLTRFYLAAKDAELAEMKAGLRKAYGEMDVLCFKRDVPGGTVLSSSDLGVMTVPKAGLRGQALVEADKMLVLGRRSVIAHRRGDVVFWSDIEGGNPVSSGLAADVKRQMRAISINASGAAAVSGMIRPNDHVDVIGTFSFPDESGRVSQGAMVTYTILQNVLVLATGSDTGKTELHSSSAGFGARQDHGYTTVTLEVTPREAEMLVFAGEMRGWLTLTLRNRNDTSAETELPQIDFQKIKGEIESLNLLRQQRMSPGFQSRP